MSPPLAAPCVWPIATPPEKLNSAFRFQAERSSVDVCENGDRTRIEYMNRLITPRSQRTIIGTVRPSIVVVCTIADAGGGEAGSYGINVVGFAVGR